MSRMESYEQRNLRWKREQIATRIKDLAQHDTDTLLRLLDETKIDMLMIALASHRIDVGAPQEG